MSMPRKKKTHREATRDDLATIAKVTRTNSAELVRHSKQFALQRERMDTQSRWLIAISVAVVALAGGLVAVINHWA